MNFSDSSDDPCDMMKTRGMHPVQLWRTLGTSVFGPSQIFGIIFFIGLDV